MRSWPLQMASRVLAGGGIVACPTEGVWGLSCDPFDADAIRRLLSMKARAPEKGLLLVVAEAQQIAGIAALDAAELEAADRAQARPTSWVVPAAPETPPWITGGRGTLAVRLTRHPLLAGLCRHWGGPLISTSANYSGRPPARNALAVRRCFPGIDQIIHGELGGERRPSQIIELATGVVLRK